MTIERARILVHPKPWGVTDLRPWSGAGDGTACIGELSFERVDAAAPPTALLLKFLFASEPLSIQVHPNDSYARSIGLPHGKSEAWYVLSAETWAKVALGLRAPITQNELRQAINDGSIANLVDWQTVKARDVIAVPAGTIHAIGAGVVIAEIQQRSDVTFRLFDHGRGRPLHTEQALAVAARSPADPQQRPERISAECTLLAATPHFILERIALMPGSKWSLDAERETWLVILNGNVKAGTFHLARGEAVFAQAERLNLNVGQNAFECLVAYTGAGGPLPSLLDQIGSRRMKAAVHAVGDLPSGMQIGTCP